MTLRDRLDRIVHFERRFEDLVAWLLVAVFVAAFVALLVNAR